MITEPSWSVKARQNREDYQSAQNVENHVDIHPNIRLTARHTKEMLAKFPFARLSRLSFAQFNAWLKEPEDTVYRTDMRIKRDGVSLNNSGDIIRISQ